MRVQDSIAPSTSFAISADRAATRPPERRGVERDGVRLLVASASGIEHARFSDLPRFLSAGDLLVVNTSATLPAAVDAVRAAGDPVVVHVSTAQEDGTWLVELRSAHPSRAPIRDAEPGETLTMRDGALLVLHEAYPDQTALSSRLWRARLASGGSVLDHLRKHGRPIRYGYVGREWPLSDYQTAYAVEPGSAEMPSAGRPFTARLLTRLVAHGVGVAPLVLHTGVSSLDAHERPYPERYAVPGDTARVVNSARGAGRRVVAVGTTVVRALESSVGATGDVVASRGWTELVVGPDQPPRVLDGLITGLHAPGSSHLSLLEALAGPELVQQAYSAAVSEDYLWHEFGDSCLLLP